MVCFYHVKFWKIISLFFFKHKNLAHKSTSMFTLGICIAYAINSKCFSYSDRFWKFTTFICLHNQLLSWRHLRTSRNSYHLQIMFFVFKKKSVWLKFKYAFYMWIRIKWSTIILKEKSTTKDAIKYHFII